MSVTASLLVVLTVVVVLLTFGFAAHQRTIARLVEAVDARPPGSSWHGGGRAGRTGFGAGDRLPAPLAAPGVRSVVVVASPGCADCHEVLGRLRDRLRASPGGARLVSVWTGAAPAWAHEDADVVVVEDRGLVDGLGVVRTPAVAVLDGDVVVESAATARADVAEKLVARHLGPTDAGTTRQEASGWS